MLLFLDVTGSIPRGGNQVRVHTHFACLYMPCSYMCTEVELMYLCMETIYVYMQAYYAWWCTCLPLWAIRSLQIHPYGHAMRHQGLPRRNTFLAGPNKFEIESWEISHWTLRSIDYKKQHQHIKFILGTQLPWAKVQLWHLGVNIRRDSFFWSQLLLDSQKCIRDYSCLFQIWPPCQ